MINESDLDDAIVTQYRRHGAVYAEDVGLMGIRCVFDARNRCQNGLVRGLARRSIRNLHANIELGARYLAMERDKGGVERRRVLERNAQGQTTVRTKLVRCQHRGHAYWAHYNHGSFYISRGPARHYPHRVAVLYYALVAGLGLPDEPALYRQTTVVDRGRRARTIDRPVEPRFRVLVAKIERAGSRHRPFGPAVALATASDSSGGPLARPAAQHALD